MRILLVLSVLLVSGVAEAASYAPRISQAADGVPVYCLSREEWPWPEARAFYDGEIKMLRYYCRSLRRLLNGERPSLDTEAPHRMSYALLTLGHELGHHHGYGREESNHHEADCYALANLTRLAERMGAESRYRATLRRIAPPFDRPCSLEGHGAVSAELDLSAHVGGAVQRDAPRVGWG